MWTRVAEVMPDCLILMFLDRMVLFDSTRPAYCGKSQELKKLMNRELVAIYEDFVERFPDRRDEVESAMQERKIGCGLGLISAE